MKSPFGSLLLQWLILAIGVVIATHVVAGIHCSDSRALVIAVLLLSFVNTFLKRVLLLLSLPFIILTMGLGIVVINAILFLLVGNIVPGFVVDGFWPAVGGSLVLSITGMVLNGFIRSSGPRPRPPPKGPPGNGDVIDI